jgi:hypothetical protein
MSSAEPHFEPVELSKEMVDDVLENAHPLAMYLMGRIASFHVDDDGMPESVSPGVVVMMACQDGHATAYAFPRSVFEQFVEEGQQLLARWEEGVGNG